MRKDNIVKDDILRDYMNPGKRAQAPEGFSSKVMSHIYMEAKPVKAEKRHNIPLFFAGIFLLLAIATVLFIPAGSLVTEFKIPLSFTFAFPEFTTGVPSTFIYIIVAVIAIMVLDSALGIIFRRERK